MEKIIGEVPEKLKLLFVDDRAKRIKFAIEQYADWDLTIAPNVKEALREMVKGYDIISLDHDLTGVSFEDPDTPTCGMEIVRYISKTGWPPQLKKPLFWIHSDNLFAAHLMVTSLVQEGFEAWYKPITYKTEYMHYDKAGFPL